MGVLDEHPPRSATDITCYNQYHKVVIILINVMYLMCVFSDHGRIGDKFITPHLKIQPRLLLFNLSHLYHTWSSLFGYG